MLYFWVRAEEMALKSCGAKPPPLAPPGRAPWDGERTGQSGKRLGEESKGRGPERLQEMFVFLHWEGGQTSFFRAFWAALHAPQHRSLKGKTEAGKKNRSGAGRGDCSRARLSLDLPDAPQK